MVRCSTPNEVQPGQVVDRVRGTAPAARFGPLPGNSALSAGGGGGRARRVVVTLMGSGVDLLHSLFFGLPFGSACRRWRASTPCWRCWCRRSAASRWASLHLPRGMAAGARGRSHRGQRAPWRPDVVYRQRDRGPADGMVERCRGVGRMEAGYTQLASGIASRIRPCLPAAAGGPALLGRLRRRRGHCRRIRRAAGGRLPTVSNS